jgi:hypothetical protein
MDVVARVGARPARFGLALVGAGGVALAVTLLRGANAFEWQPGVDGVLTMGLLGFVLLMLHGVGFGRALTVMAPILALQIPLFLLNRAPVFALLGLELVFFGAIGLGSSAGHTRPSRVP